MDKDTQKARRHVKSEVMIKSGYRSKHVGVPKTLDGMIKPHATQELAQSVQEIADVLQKTHDQFIKIQGEYIKEACTDLNKLAREINYINQNIHHQINKNGYEVKIQPIRDVNVLLKSVKI